MRPYIQGMLPPFKGGPGRVSGEGLQAGAPGRGSQKKVENYLSIPINIRNFAAAFRMEAKGCCAFWYG